MGAGPTTAPVPVPVAAAATVLLLRESDAGRLEVLLTKRAAGLAFMGGLWVFPGGRMEAADQSATAIGRLSSADVESVRQRMLDPQGRPLGAEAVLGLHVAACRETFEESGLVLARPRQGAGAIDPAQYSRLGARREAASSAEGFLELLVAEDLLLEVGRLVYWSHWITPSVEKRRFDTRFFAVRVPPGQEASVDRSELTHHAWLGEDDVRARLREGEMKMAPPTIATLQDLWRSHARHGGLDAMLDAERTRLVPPILPKIVPDGERLAVVLPWDPEYGALPGEACAAWPEYPDYLAELPSRRTLSRA
jgi:8-oxo-dGTP pyrophosphatase MutT (NUDIX family)